MQYFAVDHDAGGKSTGPVFPQVAFDNMAQAQALRYNTFVEPPPLLNASLLRRAKPSDVVSQASIPDRGFLVSERLRALLSRFHLSEHRYYDAPVATPKGTLPYYWLHLAGRESMEWVDFSRSSFWVYSYGFRSHEITLRSLEDYERVKSALDFSEWITINHAKMNERFDPGLDLFAIPLLMDARAVISERLAEVLRQERITGLELKPIPMELAGS